MSLLDELVDLFPTIFDGNPPPVISPSKEREQTWPERSTREVEAPGPPKEADRVDLGDE